MISFDNTSNASDLAAKEDKLKHKINNEYEKKVLPFSNPMNLSNLNYNAVTMITNNLILGAGDKIFLTEKKKFDSVI